MSLADYARAHGAGEPVAPVLDLKDAIVRHAVQWFYRMEGRGGAPLEREERALYKAVERYKAATTRRGEQT
jgi:hypothetical protein